MGAMRARAIVAASMLLALAAAGPGAAAQQAAAPQGAGSQASSAQRALLVRGADPVKGLPFFPPNAIPALEGAYSLGGGAKGPELAVWYTRESLILGGAWKRAEVGGLPAFVLARSEGNVVVLRSAQYYLFFELPSGGDSRWRAFIPAFDRKFLVFFENAASDAELSFPAYIDY
jgi:hypothetical protein